MDFKQLQQALTTANTAYETERKRIDKLVETKERQIKKLEAKKRKLTYPHWTEYLVRPVLNEIEKALPEWKRDSDRLSVFGLGCRCPVFFYHKDDNEADRDERIVGITFLPGDLDNAELRYETGKQECNYPANSIGYLNGFNNITKPVESIEELIAFLKTKIAQLQTAQPQAEQIHQTTF